MPQRSRSRSYPLSAPLPVIIPRWGARLVDCRYLNLTSGVVAYLALKQNVV
jgi:hypothetical protein